MKSGKGHQGQSGVMRFQRKCAALALLAVASLASMPALTQPSPMPASPVTINVVDVGGALALLQDAIEAYQTKYPKVVAKINFTKAPAPELPGKLKAMQAAGRSDIDLVLGGNRYPVGRHRAAELGANSSGPRGKVFPTCSTTIFLRRARCRTWRRIRRSPSCSLRRGRCSSTTPTR